MNRVLMFDLDGTLVDSRDAVIESVAHTAEHFAPGQFSREELVSRFGESFDDFLMDVALAAGKLDKSEVLSHYFAHVRAHLEDHATLFTGVRDGLEQLKAAGYQLAIVTNKQREFAVATLELAGIAGLFDAVVAVDDVARGKPSAEPLQKALQELDKQPWEAVMIGDSRFDVLASKAAGVPAVVLEWYGREEWTNANPDKRFPDFQTFAFEMLTVKTKAGG
ncbi:HAD family hydrolase [Brevibacillus sp. TJ4]|uniref:HAD family hydrolase n=1 Tax=Brevibacillus sp. TJ4 TaxID=3234853 RepID=UPI0037CE36E0